MGRDGVAGLVVLAASLFLFWATLGLERHPMVPVGPGFYPRLVLGTTALLALALLVADLRAGKRQALPRANYARVAVAFGIFGAYVLAMPYLGFRLATFLFLVALPPAIERPAGPRRWIVIVVLAVVATVATHLVFERYLHVLLPRGRWTGW